MSQLQEKIILLFSLPIYAVLIPLEIFLSNFQKRNFYTLKETLMNIYLNLVNSGIDIILRTIALIVLIYVFNFGGHHHTHIAAALSPVLYWLLLFIGEDFFFWLEHYVDHKCRLFWAVHVTHHSSTEYNLTTGFRSSVLMPLYRFIYFIPLALVGFRAIDIFFMYAVTQIYGILVHTRYIKKLPKWIEYIFVTPSHHRVHHASNIIYLDKNMGMALIIWDRIFGTFQEEIESEPPVYGIVKQMHEPHHPLSIITHEWADLGKDIKRKLPFTTRIKYIFMPPGWSHDGTTKTARQLQQELH